MQWSQPQPQQAQRPRVQRVQRVQLVLSLVLWLVLWPVLGLRLHVLVPPLLVLHLWLPRHPRHPRWPLPLPHLMPPRRWAPQ